MPNHLTDDQLIAYQQQILTSDERELVASHLADCAVCQSKAEPLAALSGQLRQALAAELDTLAPPPTMQFSAIAPRLSKSRRRQPIVRLPTFASLAAGLATVVMIFVLGVVLLDSRPEPFQPGSAATIPAADVITQTPPANELTATPPPSEDGGFSSIPTRTPDLTEEFSTRNASSIPTRTPTVPLETDDSSQ